MFDADLSLVPADARVLVAVSGGADSMALLHWLLEHGRDVVVGHVNHALDELRQGACARDEEWLRVRCAELHVPFVSETLEWPEPTRHINEADAREQRYDALRRIARLNDCPLVATAHTASDALEGMILNVGRGAGVRGQNGFAPSRALGDRVLVRPFWRIGREEVREWLRLRNQSWLEDESNQNPVFRRNRVRSEIVPLLATIFGRSDNQLSRGFASNAQLARDEDAFVESAARQALETLVLKREERLLTLDGAKFVALPVALQRRVIRLAAGEISPSAHDTGRMAIETVRTAITSGQKRAVWTWRNDVRVEMTGVHAGNRLRFWRV